MDIRHTKTVGGIFDLSVLDDLEKQDTPTDVSYRIPRQYTFNIHCNTNNERKVLDFLTVCWYTKRWWTWIQQVSPINNLDPEKVVIQVSSLSEAISWTRKWWESKPTVANLFFSPAFTSTMGQIIKRNALYTATKSMTSVSGSIKWTKKYFTLYPTKIMLRVRNNKVDCYRHDFKEGFIRYNDKLHKISLILTSSYETQIKQYRRSKYAEGRACGIDPGLLSFITVYDPTAEKRCIKLGNKREGLWLHNSFQEEKDCRKMIRSSFDEQRCEDLQAEIQTIRSNRKLLLDNFFHRICQYLIANYSTINIGDFCSYDDVWNHDRFYNILLSYSNDVCKVFVINEQNTSIICSNCGRITPTKNTRTYTCQFCTVILDRDMNAAKNILQMGYKCTKNAKHLQRQKAK